MADVAQAGFGVESVAAVEDFVAAVGGGAAVAEVAVGGVVRVGGEVGLQDRHGPVRVVGVTLVNRAVCLDQPRHAVVPVVGVVQNRVVGVGIVAVPIAIVPTDDRRVNIIRD